MDDEFEISVGFAAIGSLCIFIGTTIIDKFNLFLLKEIVAGFLITGFSMIFLSAAVLFGGMVNLDWDKENFLFFVGRIAIVIFFFTSFLLGLSYIASLFGFAPIS